MAKLALLIGVSEYQSGLNPLPAAVKDVEAMQEVLQHPEIGGFDAVKLLKNPSLEEMQIEIETLFANRQEDDLVLLFFSGHGITDESGKFFFTTRITQKNQQNRLIKATAVPAIFVHDIMSNSDSQRQIVILDCCFSGAFPKGMMARDGGSINLKQELGGKGRVVLTSSTSTQYSFEQQGEELAVYTRYLVEGMKTGAADLDNDGAISVDELHEYVKEKVHKAAPAMQPEIYAVKEGYKIQLAKAPIGDPKLKYRKEVERFTHRGEISPTGRRILNRQRQELGLSPEEATLIEEEVLKPYREYQQNLEEYRQALLEEIQREYPLSNETYNHLKYLQKILNLRDEDIAPVTEQIIGNLRIAPTFEFDVLTVDAQGREINRRRNQAEFFTEDLGNGVILEMVSIPGGTFQMGSSEYDSEKPQHSVTVKPFFMGKYAVTQAQWKVVAALPQINLSLNPDPSHFKGANRPVEKVSWHEAQEFCARLAKKMGKTYRLPSEAEWEYACRAGTTTPFHFGETITAEIANYKGNYTYASAPKGIYREQTTDVGSFPPNAFGLYDMHGNVWEWCADPLHENYNGAPSDGSVWESGGDNTYRLVRGGSWYDDPGGCRSANRGRDVPVSGFRDCGFRVVAVSSAWTH